MVLLGRTLIRWWAGPAAVPAFPLLLMMGAWTIINGLMNVESCLLAALSKTRRQALLSVIAAAVNLTLSIVLVRHIGALGVISGTVLSYLIVLVVPQTLIVRDALRVSNNSLQITEKQRVSEPLPHLTP
jgi:O-antigen/teichoic acid export membrane protein